MQRAKRSVPLLLSFVLTLALGLSFAAATSSSKESTEKTATTTRNSPATNKPTASHMKESHARRMSHVLASPENLSGTISVVDPSDKEVTLVGSNGIPYDFDLTRKTQVELANQKIGIRELSSETHKLATVHFVPTSRGNLAESIQISAS